MELSEDVDPIVVPGKPDLEIVDKINTPEVRCSSRCNKGVDKKLEQDYDIQCEILSVMQM